MRAYVYFAYLRYFMASSCFLSTAIASLQRGDSAKKVSRACRARAADQARCKPVQGAAPEIAPAPAGRIEGRGSRQTQNAPAF
jgi:hypothetical protein